MLFPVGVACFLQSGLCAFSSRGCMLFPVGVVCFFQSGSCAFSSQGRVLFPVRVVCFFQSGSCAFSSQGRVIFPVRVVCFFQSGSCAFSSRGFVLFAVGGCFFPVKLQKKVEDLETTNVALEKRVAHKLLMAEVYRLSQYIPWSNVVGRVFYLKKKRRLMKYEMGILDVIGDFDKAHQIGKV